MLRPEMLSKWPGIWLGMLSGRWPGMRLSKRLPWVFACLLGMSLPLAAQEDPAAPPPIPPEDAKERPLPPKVEGEEVEPTVTIREEDDKTYEEYRYNGQIYMVKVTPKVGLPYYLIDANGDGMLEATPDKGLSPVNPVHWKVKEWD